MATKSEKIQALVQQMKAGAISKSELFTQLSLLQRTSAKPEAAAADGALYSDGADDSDGARESNRESNCDSNSESGSASEGEYAASAGADRPSAGAAAPRETSTPERRAEIIRRLFEEKRRARAHAGSPATSASTQASAPDADFWEDSTKVLERMRQRQEQTQPSASQPTAGSRGPKARPSSAPRARPQSPSLRLGPGEAAPRSFMYESRMRRLQEELVRKQMAECTFKPRINALPEQYGGASQQQQSGLTFEERVALWKQRKAEETERKRREQAEAELEGCTFQPRVNAARGREGAPPDRAQTPRGRCSTDAFGGAGTGPPRDADGVEAGGSMASARAPRAFERLYQQSKEDKLAQLQTRAREEAEAELRRVCTFKPKLRKSAAFAARSRYRDAAAAAASAGDASAAAPARRTDGAESVASSGARRKMGWDDECTFTPRTNPVHPSMEAAQVYLSNDIFSRLSQPRPASPQDRAQPQQQQPQPQQQAEPMELDDFLRSAGSQRPSSAPRQRPASAGAASAGAASARRQSFEAFLARQQQTELRRRTRVHEVARQTASSHQPQLCKRSVDLATQRTPGSFLERVARGAIRKEHDAVRLKARSVDPECTFRPQITRAAAQRPARSAVELSRGDSLRRETNSRLMKLRMEQQEQQELTFAPEVNVDGRAQGRLQILSDPDSYIQRLQHKSALRSRRQSQAAADQEMKELEECTFRPQIHEAPAYVKRIAKSLALSKSARSEAGLDDDAGAQQQRPEWR